MFRSLSKDYPKSRLLAQDFLFLLRYQLVRLEKATGPAPDAEERRQSYSEQVERVLSQSAVSAYIEEVKSGMSIERNLSE